MSDYRTIITRIQADKVRDRQLDEHLKPKRRCAICLDSIAEWEFEEGKAVQGDDGYDYHRNCVTEEFV